ncbi:SEC-C metal-binding domain-containing protein [Bacillus sp. FJAT-27251]|uniref:YecA family protein n=1 Tax=Bacillus sp. FJAT-27251 TaxID=1684142 RepID=UPI0006A7DD9D|nr:SEC-C metal-binding domain-containing protein [Bacillus sp. FJAT-27251]
MYERNAPCPCGSGKKYKKCCLNKVSNPVDIWKQRAIQLSADLDNSNAIANTFFKVFEHSLKKGWRGACHALSGILYVLLHEQGIKGQINIGFVKSPKVPFLFSHSWVEIDGKVYDLGLYRSNASIYSGKLYEELSSPIFKGINLEENIETPIEYGLKSNREGTDSNLNAILKMTLGEYMDGWKFHKEGLWGEIIEIASQLEINLCKDELKTKYNNVKFNLQKS